jgi:hypothetical protein
MLPGQNTVEEQVATYESDVIANDLEIGNSRIGIGMIMVMAGFVGIWGCLCLINGIAQSSSLQELSRGIVTALTGI